MHFLNQVNAQLLKLGGVKGSVRSVPSQKDSRQSTLHFAVQLGNSLLDLEEVIAVLLRVNLQHVVYDSAVKVITFQVCVTGSGNNLKHPAVCMAWNTLAQSM